MGSTAGVASLAEATVTQTAPLTGYWELADACEALLQDEIVVEQGKKMTACLTALNEDASLQSCLLDPADAADVQEGAYYGGCGGAAQSIGCNSFERCESNATNIWDTRQLSKEGWWL